MSTLRRRGEGGFTLIEVTVTSALILVILAIVLPQLISGLNVYTDAQVRSDTSDQAQVALGQIQHDVLTSNVLSLDNSLPNGTGVVHLQSFGQGGGSTCVEYQVAGGALQRRTKTPAGAWPIVAPLGWTDVITGIVNGTQTPVPAVFTNDVNSQYRSLLVVLWVNADKRTVAAASPAKYTTTVTGRAIPANQSSTAGPC